MSEDPSDNKNIALKMSASSHKEAVQQHKASRSRRQRDPSHDSEESSGEYGRRRRSRSRSFSPGRRKRRDSDYRSNRDRDPRDRSKVEVWNNKVCILGEKVNDILHFCDTCDRPIRLYGRLIPCKHVFCKNCAAHSHSTKCGKCSEPVIRIEQVAQGNIFMCYHGGSAYSKHGCRRTYLSQRDLQAHVEHRHERRPAGSGTPPQSGMTMNQAPQQAAGAVVVAAAAAAAAAQMPPPNPGGMMASAPTFVPPPFVPPRLPAIPTSLTHNFLPPTNFQPHQQQPPPANVSTPGMIPQQARPPMNMPPPPQMGFHHPGAPPQFNPWATAPQPPPGAPPHFRPQ